MRLAVGVVMIAGCHWTSSDGQADAGDVVVDAANEDPLMGCTGGEVDDVSSDDPSLRVYGTPSSTTGEIRRCGVLTEVLATCDAFARLEACTRARFECACEGEVRTVLCRDVEQLTTYEKRHCSVASWVAPGHPLYDAATFEGPFPTAPLRYVPDAVCRDETSAPTGRYRVGLQRCRQTPMTPPAGFLSCVLRHSFGANVGEISSCGEIHDADPAKQQAFRSRCEADGELRVDQSCPRTPEFVMACQKREPERYAARYYYAPNFPFTEGWLTYGTHSEVTAHVIDCMDQASTIGVLHPWYLMPEYFNAGDGSFRGGVRGAGVSIVADDDPPMAIAD